MDRIENELREAAAPASEPDGGLMDGLAAAAAARGLLDVAFATCDSPVGTLLLARTDAGLVRVAYGPAGLDVVVEGLADRISSRVLESPGRLDAVRRQLEEYFEGRRRDFDLALDWRLTGGFRRRVLEATARLPYGSTASYREVARAAGNG